MKRMFFRWLARNLGIAVPREEGNLLEWGGETYLRLPAAVARGYYTASDLPDESPLMGDEFFATKQEAGLSIMDDDTHGFLLLTLKKDGHGGDIAIHGHVPREYVPPFQMTLVRMLVETERVVG